VEGRIDINTCIFPQADYLPHEHEKIWNFYSLVISQLNAFQQLFRLLIFIFGQIV
jgi:hypothetical protein